MQTTTLNYENLHLHGELFANVFRTRHSIFNTQKGWEQPSVNSMEYDQYDTPATNWVTVHDGDKVVAGVRLNPTTARCGIYSYMLRDAQRGLLDGLPTDLLFEPAPISNRIWEGTRIFVSQEVPAQERRRVHLMLVQAMVKSARALGATSIIGVIPETLPKIGRRCGLDMTLAGPPMDIGGERNVCVDINIDPDRT